MVDTLYVIFIIRMYVDGTVSVIKYNKMNNKKCQTVGTVPKSNRKIVGTQAKSITLTHIYVYISLFTFLAWYRQLDKK